MNKSDTQRDVLIIDDSPVILRTLQLILTNNGFNTWAADSAEKGLKIIQEQGLPDLAIVDLHLPRMNGFAFCKKVQRFSDLPIIMLSSDSSEDMVVQGLTNFAEDFIVKTDPNSFREKELLSRINRVLNRLGELPWDAAPLLSVDDRLQVDFYKRQARVQNNEIKLTPTESRILHILMRHAGETVGYDYLLRRLWPSEMAFEDRLHTHVHRLRKKIEQVPRDPKYIVGAWGAGYRFPDLS
ncbi:MAG: response regulator transcription factor [Anaerolineae bacterium]